MGKIKMTTELSQEDVNRIAEAMVEKAMEDVGIRDIMIGSAMGKGAIPLYGRETRKEPCSCCLIDPAGPNTPDNRMCTTKGAIGTLSDREEREWCSEIKIVSDGRCARAMAIREAARECKEKHPSDTEAFFQCYIPAFSAATKESNPARVHFDRADIDSAIEAAKRLKSDRDLYIFATHLGYTIDKRPPPGMQQYVIVHTDGSTETIKPGGESNPGTPYQEEGERIARQLGNGVIYNGPQMYNDKLYAHIFTDAAVTGTTFACLGLEECKANLIQKRKDFGAAPPAFSQITKGGNPGTVPEVTEDFEHTVIGRMASGEANLLQTPEGELIERIAGGEKRGWWKILVGKTEYVGKTPADVLNLARRREAMRGEALPKALPAKPRTAGNPGLPEPGPPIPDPWLMTRTEYEPLARSEFRRVTEDMIARLEERLSDFKPGMAAYEDTLRGIAMQKQQLEEGLTSEGIRFTHRLHVRKAFLEGKPVPAEVLADYPDLSKGAI
ncbi:hypothetical protein ES705_08417 [subsurface metagenome]